MSKLHVLLAFLFLLVSTAGHAQSKKVEMTLQFLSSETLAEVNVDEKEFLDYEKLFNDELEKSLTNLTASTDVYVVQTVHKGRAASVDVVARPALGAAETSKIMAALLAIKSPQTKHSDFSLLYMAKVNGGAADASAAFVPALVLPAVREKAAFEALPLAGQYQEIKRWAAEEALPVLAAFETKVDDKFAGVRAVGNMLTTNSFAKKQDVGALTESNSSYWRACLEMSRGNQLIPVSKALMLASQGEFDRAGLYLTVLEPFSDPKAMATQLAQELQGKLKLFNQKLNAEMQKGIARHDTGAYADAVAIYSQVLAIHPASAWANYEKYFSQNTLAMSKSKAPTSDLWKNAQAVIYRCNPMYPSQGQANSGKELYQLTKRQRLTELFKTKGQFQADYIEYADTALQLGDYGLAAQMNWLIFSSFPKESQGSENRLAYFLYALDKLGNREIATNFKGDFKSEFAKIDTRFDKEMKDSPTYKAFKN